MTYSVITRRPINGFVQTTVAMIENGSNNKSVNRNLLLGASAMLDALNQSGWNVGTKEEKDLVVYPSDGVDNTGGLVDFDFVFRRNGTGGLTGMVHFELKNLTASTFLNSVISWFTGTYGDPNMYKNYICTCAVMNLHK